MNKLKVGDRVRILARPEGFEYDVVGKLGTIKNTDIDCWPLVDIDGEVKYYKEKFSLKDPSIHFNEKELELASKDVSSSEWKSLWDELADSESTD